MKLWNSKPPGTHWLICFRPSIQNGGRLPLTAHSCFYDYAWFAIIAVSKVCPIKTIHMYTQVVSTTDPSSIISWLYLINSMSTISVHIYIYDQQHV
jgi:hypothetical protein